MEFIGVPCPPTVAQGAAVWQTNTILIKTPGPNGGSQPDNYEDRGWE
jgi:hypothetical protein